MIFHFELKGWQIFKRETRFTLLARKEEEGCEGEEKGMRKGE